MYLINDSHSNFKSAINFRGIMTAKSDSGIKDGTYFRGTNWQVDINLNDAYQHMLGLNLVVDMQVILNYFTYILFVDTDKLGKNEFSARHQEIKDGIIAILSKKYDTGAKLISTDIEGIVRDSLVNDKCLDNGTPYRNWTGDFHEHKQPTNFFQIFEGALEDPRSRIGRTIFYPATEEIYHISEMIRNPLAHGALMPNVFLNDYKGLFFTLILLFHDLVNPHNYQLNDKYRRWISLIERNMRLKGETPTLDKVIEIGKIQKLDLDQIKTNYPSVQPPQ